MSWNKDQFKISISWSVREFGSPTSRGLCGIVWIMCFLPRAVPQNPCRFRWKNLCQRLQVPSYPTTSGPDQRRAGMPHWVGECFYLSDPNESGGAPCRSWQQCVLGYSGREWDLGVGQGMASCLWICACLCLWIAYLAGTEMGMCRWM